MFEEQLAAKVGTAEKRPRRKRRTVNNDPGKDLHARLDRFLENPTNPSTLDSLVAGLVDFELRARLTALHPQGEDHQEEGSHD